MPRCRTGTRSGSCARTCPSSSSSTAGTACSATAWCRGASRWRSAHARSSSATCCRATSSRSAGIRGRADALQQVRIADQTLWSVGSQTWMIALLETEAAAETAIWFVPFALVWEDTDDERTRALAPATIARVRQQAQVGVFAEASADDAFCRALVDAIGAGKGDRHRARQDPLHADFGVFPHRRGGHGSAAAPAGRRRKAATPSSRWAPASFSRCTGGCGRERASSWRWAAT